MERRSFDREFREGAVRIVRETGRPIAQVARELGLHEGTLGRWVNLDRRAREGEVKHPRFYAHPVTCDRCAFRRGVERSTRPRLPRVGGAGAGA